MYYSCFFVLYPSICLWLLLFTGAFRIYVLILKPYFERNENEIDKLVAKGVTKVQTSVSGYLQNLLYHLVIESNKSFLASLLTAEKPTATVATTVDASTNGMVMEGLKSALTMLNAHQTSVVENQQDLVRGSGRKSHRHGQGHGHGQGQGLHHVNLLLEFCHLLQEGVAVSSPTLEFNRIASGNGWSVSFGGENNVAAAAAGLGGCVFEPCVLLLNHHKNQLMVRFPASSCGPLALSVQAGSSSNATGLCIALWNISQVCIDEVEPEESDDEEDDDWNGGVDKGKNDGNTSVRQLSSKTLLLDTLHPVLAFKTTGGMTQRHLSTVTSLTIRAATVVLSDETETRAGVGMEARVERVDADANAVSEGNELLDSIGYGLPMLIQQYKSNTSKRWGRVDKILLRKMASRRPKIFQSPDTAVDKDSKCFSSDAKSSAAAVMTTTGISSLSSDMCDERSDCKGNSNNPSGRKEVTEDTVCQRSLSTSFLMWKLAIFAGLSRYAAVTVDAKAGAKDLDSPCVKLESEIKLKSEIIFTA